MRSMISGDFTRGSAHRTGTPLSAYGGRAMCVGHRPAWADDALQHSALERLVATLVLAAAAAPARIVGLGQRGRRLSFLQHRMSV